MKKSRKFFTLELRTLDFSFLQCYFKHKSSEVQKISFMAENNKFRLASPPLQELNYFTWSMRRREMLARCPREYFYHYYGSVGGAFLKTGTEKAELLHLLRNTVPAEAYIRRILLHGIRHFFNAGAVEAPNFREHLVEQLTKEYRSMLLGHPEHDHKLPLLLEMTQPGFSPQKLKEELFFLLQKQGEAVEKNLLPFLFKVSPENRLERPVPLRIHWNGLDTFCTPFALWRTGDGLRALCAGAESEENSALMLFYAMDQLKVAPDKVELFHLNDEFNFYPAARLFSCTAPFKRIKADVDRMLFLEEQSGGVKEKYFPQELHNCATCRFRSFCEQN
jgi:hypothetical protein